MVKIAKERCTHFCWNQVTVGDGRLVPFVDGVFDMVFAIRVLNQTGSKENALAVLEDMIMSVLQISVIQYEAS